MQDSDLFDLLAGVFVSVAIIEGKLGEDQRKWAEERFKVDPMAFKRYVQRPPAPTQWDFLPGHTDRLNMEIQRLRAENAAQEGAIKALNAHIIGLEMLSTDQNKLLNSFIQERNNSSPEPQLPRWQSHKIVEADKIVKVWHNGSCWDLDCGATIDASEELRNRVPRGVAAVGGYYVRYADNFESWSPAEAFEKGYTKIEERDVT